MLHGDCFVATLLAMTCCASTARDCHDDVDIVARLERRVQILCDGLVNEDPDVLANLVLFVDDAKANALILTVEVAKELGERRAVGLDDILFGVRTQRRWDVDFHGI